MEKRQRGAYYTEGSPFRLRPFLQWAEAADLANSTVLEPFAGSNNIVNMLIEDGLCSRADSYDIAPEVDDVAHRDTLSSFPGGYEVCVTNPPWLARNSARRRGLAFDVPLRYDDIYKYALDIALQHCQYVAFIIPATFIRSRLFRERLESFVLIERPLFVDTDNPVCLALFGPRCCTTEVWIDDRHVGTLDKLEHRNEQYMYGSRHPRSAISFNAPGGDLGLIGVDNTREPSIRFCRGSELAHRSIKHTDRAITRIDLRVKVTGSLIDRLNDGLARFRAETHDLFLAPFKGLRADGRYRRRLDYETARGLISAHA